MTTRDDIYSLPADLPAPSDDGACDHLEGLALPNITLQATNGDKVNLSNIEGRVVVYCYPRTGEPDRNPPQGWNEIPGARGCTPQSCAFRDHYQELRDLGVAVYGLSSQDTAYQQEAVERLHLPYPLLSDEKLAFASALGLPTFEIAGMILIKRITLIIDGGCIEKVFYPVFPPDKNAAEVIDYLRESATADAQ